MKREGVGEADKENVRRKKRGIARGGGARQKQGDEWE